MNFKFSNLRAPTEKGATIVETVIALPLFLAVFLFFIFIGIAYNAKTSLAQATGMARHAYTRGQSSLVGSEIIQSVQDWQGGFVGSTYLPPADVQALLSSPAESGSAFGAGGYYNSTTQTNYAGADFIDLPTPDIYALIYAYQSMLQSVGPTLRFPCDPNLANGSGCMRCRNINPSEFDGSATLAPTTFGFNTQFIGLQCEYRPSSIFVDPIVALLRVMIGNAAMAPLIFVERREFPFA